MKPQIPPLPAMLMITGWHGSTVSRVLIVGETPKRYTIRALARTKLAGRGRWISRGEEAMVPRSAVRVEPALVNWAGWEDAAEALALKPRRPRDWTEAEEMARVAKVGS